MSAASSDAGACHVALTEVRVRDLHANIATCGIRVPLREHFECHLSIVHSHLTDDDTTAPRA